MRQEFTSEEHIESKGDQFGECPCCGYELSIKESNYSPTGGESYSQVREALLRYHYEASPECLEFKKEDEDVRDSIKSMIKPLTVNFPLRISEDLHARLSKCADENEVKMSQLVRGVLNKFLTDLKY